MNNAIEQRVMTAFYGRFANLREAQEATIEPLLDNRNVILTSGTGSGKTEAVMAPLVNKYWRKAIETDSLFLLYIAPTKALVNDLEKRLHPPLAALNLRVGVRHGDRDDLKSGATPHILITTPESLDVMLFRKDSALQSLRAVVIDEVHLLYNTQRGLQLSILLRRLEQKISHKIQCAALSATVGDLSHVRDFLLGPGTDADLLAFSATRSIDAQIRHIADIGQLCSLVRRLTEGRKTKLLVFANSRRECERLSEALHGIEPLRNSVFTHYSSQSPELRLDIEQKFALIDTAICIATSTMELGIDIGDIDVVLLWGLPTGVDSFLQRIGRGNRRSNKTNVVCLVPDNSTAIAIDALHFASLLETAKKGDFPVQEPYDLFGAVGQQCLSMIASYDGRFTRIADICQILEHQTYLKRDLVESILAELASNEFLQRHGYRNRYGAGDELHRLVDMRIIYGNFPVGSQRVDLFHGTKLLGSVPTMNLLRLRGPSSVRFAGRCWQVKKASRDGIHLEPSSGASGVINFSYGGARAPSNGHNANRLWRLIHNDDMSLDAFTNDLRNTVQCFRESIRSYCSEDQIPFLRSAKGIRYYTFAGYLVNRAVGLYTEKPDFKADEFSILVPSPIDWHLIPDSPSGYRQFFHVLFEASLAQSIYQKQLPLELQQREYIQEWLKDTAILFTLARLSKAQPQEIPGEAVEGLGFPD